MARLTGIPPFGPVWDQAGVRGFRGEGYWFHHALRPLGLDLRDSTFVAKTTTLRPREGNMPLRPDWAPKTRFPSCVVVKPWSGVVLNAVGLSGPGAMELFRAADWEQRAAPFMLSFMAVEKTAQERINECIGFAQMMGNWLENRGTVLVGHLRHRIGLQLNLSCPNAGQAPRDPTDFFKEANAQISALSGLGVPIFPKFSVTTSPEVAAAISDHYGCHGVVISNTIPWGMLPDAVDWKGLFGSDASPLAHLGGGGLSGAPLLKLVRRWIIEARQKGMSKSIAAGGGILRPKDVDVLADAGANAVCVGAAAILRPWRVRSIVRRAHELAGRNPP